MEQNTCAVKVCVIFKYLLTDFLINQQISILNICFFVQGSSYCRSIVEVGKIFIFKCFKLKMNRLLRYYTLTLMTNAKLCKCYIILLPLFTVVQAIFTMYLKAFSMAPITRLSCWIFFSVKKRGVVVQGELRSEDARVRARGMQGVLV